MANLVDQKVQEIFMPTEAIQQQRESSCVKESRRSTTDLEDQTVLMISTRMK